MSRKRTLILCAGVLGAAAVVTGVIFSTEPVAERTGAVKRTAMLVDVVEVHRGTFRPVIVATGLVEPAEEVMLSPRVGGEIVERSPAFDPGGFVERGSVMLRIDPSDYEIALARSRSALHQAEADLQMELGRRTVAEQDYALLDESIPEAQKALVLREPQLGAARSRVESARAAVDQARLDLRRTTVTAPFDAHVLTRHANLGSQVSPGDDLGHLVGLEKYWVAVTVPLAKLRWLEVPGEGEEGGSRVTLRNRTAWPGGEFREGTLFRVVGALEGQTRMARLLVTVEDPLARGPDAGDAPALMIGAFVEASIEGREIDDVVRLPREYVRADDSTWVLDDGQLRVRMLEIVVLDAEYAYVRDGLADGDRVVTTNLATVTDGAPLRLQ